jgi:hypothetical protein
VERPDRPGHHEHTAEATANDVPICQDLRSGIARQRPISPRENPEENPHESSRDEVHFTSSVHLRLRPITPSIFLIRPQYLKPTFTDFHFTCSVHFRSPSQFS